MANPITPCGIELKVGQVWKEVDPRFEDFTLGRLRITGWGELPSFGRLRPVTEMRVTYERSGKKLTAKLSRFTGKRGGYALERDVQ